MKTENSFLLIHLYFDDIQRSSSGTTFYKYINIYIYIYIYIQKNILLPMKTAKRHFQLLPL